MKTKLHYVFSLSLFLIGALAFGQKNQWTKISPTDDMRTTSKINLKNNNGQFYRLSDESFKQSLESAPLRGADWSNTVVSLPVNNGDFESFRIYEAPVFSPSLSESYPDIKSYVGFGLNSSAITRISVSPQGIQATTSYADSEATFIMPITNVSNEYVSYSRSEKTLLDEGFECLTIDEPVEHTDASGIMNRDANDQTLRTYRLAISVNGEYTQYHGGTVAGALAAVNATITRVNAVFETDMAITFQLVDAPELIFTDPATDPYSNMNNWSSELQSTLTSTIGEAAYDIGHFFGATGGGGFAGCIGCVCQDGSKGSGITSPADGIPEGDTYDIDYVAHEMGHQMGANHTFAYNVEGTGVNAEPGSGTTIMGYAGITGSNDVQSHSDAYFHFHSINQILTNVASFPNTCAATTPIGNNPPAADAGSSFTIPAGTAYVLMGSATDADGGDALSYCWEQINSGQVTSSNFGPTLTNGSVNRSLPPSSSPDRYIPNLDRQLNGQLTETNPTLGSDWETVSNVSRSMTWALTVRDRAPSATGLNGQSSFDLMAVTVTANAGPFAVTSQATGGIIWNQGNTETITWDVAGTTANGINTSNVNILLSTDGGLNFDTVLAANTPNDGTEDIVVPNTPAPYCRIKVEPVGNIYYAINSETFSIDYEVTTSCTQYDSGSINLSIPDGAGANVQGTPVFNTLNIPDSNTINSMKVNVDVSHTWIGDLIIQLQHPNGSAFANVWSRNCNSAQYNSFDVIFEDGAPSISCASPTTGTYAPASPLSVFNGLDTAGDWVIVAVDFYNQDTGTLNDWYLEFCTTTETPLSVQENEFLNFSLYPNPNNGEFTVKFRTISGRDAVDIQVSDIRGRTIFSNNYTATGSEFNETINLGQLQSGMYLVNVTDGQRKITKKIIVE